MKTLLFTLNLFSAVIGLSANASVDCVRTSDGKLATAQGDAFYLSVQNTPGCPEDVHELKKVFENFDLRTLPYMVSNRGFHNSNSGSFSFFEEVVGPKVQSGQVYFGHFTSVEGGKLVLDQTPEKGKLMVELIAWDPAKGLYNFYELIGMGSGAQWFYRGDSQDILIDNAIVHFDSNMPKFGNRLRCSGFHSSGGPIMKELKFPHNDWWTQTRPLPVAMNSVAADVAKIMSGLKDASIFSQSVQLAITNLERSGQYQAVKAKLPSAAGLRPLFCENEINIESDVAPLESGKRFVMIPSASLVNPLLAVGEVRIAKSAYTSLVAQAGLRFPESNRPDADHPWLTPVKAQADLVAIESLIARKKVSIEFAADVLAVDFQNPSFSAKRCGLFQLLVSSTGQSGFMMKLQNSQMPGASELYENLTNPAKNLAYHKAQAQEYLVKLNSQIADKETQVGLFTQLLQKRIAVFESQISQNPRGQILEPGFRIVFPVAR